jgi:endo-1,4-beta-xylanase
VPIPPPAPSNTTWLAVDPNVNPGLQNGLAWDGTVWSNPFTRDQPYTTHHTFLSAANGNDSGARALVGYKLFLPNGYGSGTQRYPVIYLLHGRGSDETENGIAFDTEAPIIGVWVNSGRNSKYQDALPGSPMYMKEMPETTLMREVIPHIDANYRTIASREGRAVIGFSMGGAGALRIAFKYPELFSSVQSASGAVDDNASNVMRREAAMMAMMFNNDPARFEAGTAQTVARINRANIRAHGLRVKFWVGTREGLHSDNIALAGLLRTLGIRHQFVAIHNGGHTPPGADAITWARRWFY